MTPTVKQHPASFRDPAGFVYHYQDQFYRFVHRSYQPHYNQLQQTGLAAQLVAEQRLLPFELCHDNHTGTADWLLTLKPEQLQFTSYPWEWCFDQLKDAALATLDICTKALQHGLVLKDATPLNIQFVRGRAMLIDHLSFELYETGSEWKAYKQFCECFLNPLALAAYCQLPVHRSFQAWPGGVPAAVTAPLLPFRTRMNLHLLLHVHLQARITAAKSGQASQRKQLSQKKLLEILESLRLCINRLPAPVAAGSWHHYYDQTILSADYLSAKQSIVQQLLHQLHYRTVLDAGTNEGYFALNCRPDALVVAMDADETCINKLYQQVKQQQVQQVLPLVADLMHPSPAMGFGNKEQASLLQRSSFDLCLALALVHHLCIGNNLPLRHVVQLMAQLCTQLIIEFVPKTDPKVQEMLQRRTDIFPDYHQEGFEAAFLDLFTIEQKEPIPHSNRIVYHMKRK